MNNTHTASELIDLLFPLTGNGTFDKPRFGRSTLDPDTSEHPTGGKCRVCGSQLETLWKNADQTRSDDREFWLFRGWMPIQCCEVCHAKPSGVYSEAEALYLERCPIEFRIAWDAGKGDDGARVKALRFDPRLRKGMILHGASGAGKTRIAWLLAKSVGQMGLTWLWIDSLDYLDTLPTAAFKVDVLFLDDLGNEPLGSQSEVRLLKLIRSRCDWHKPIVATTQHQGDSLSKRFREGASAQAVVRRLREFCDGLYVKHS